MTCYTSFFIERSCSVRQHMVPALREVVAAAVEGSKVSGSERAAHLGTDCKDLLSANLCIRSDLTTFDNLSDVAMVARTFKIQHQGSGKLP
jgi:hypothetical protein